MVEHDRRSLIVMGPKRRVQPYIVRGTRMIICVFICVTYGRLYSAWYVHEHMREHMRDVRTLDTMTGTEVAMTLWDAEGVR